MKLALTYDDVQIVPKYSEIESRSQCNTKSKLFLGVDLNIPIISSPMDTVSESNMITKLIQLGATGVLHRFNTIEQQSAQFNEIKNNFNENVPIICAIGANGDYLERTQELHRLGCQ
jgi:IMP dehydrogenase